MKSLAKKDILVATNIFSLTTVVLAIAAFLLLAVHGSDEFKSQMLTTIDQNLILLYCSLAALWASILLKKIPAKALLSVSSVALLAIAVLI